MALSHHHYHFNVFRVLGDLSHTVSKCILIWAIYANRSAEGQMPQIISFVWSSSLRVLGISMITQLLLLRQTTVPTVIDSFYLVTLGSYRAFYILNWIVRYFGKEHHIEPIATIFGTVQTAFYIDFAWVYWTRQRVKLRNGGVVDSEDFSRGWLMGRFFGQNENDEEQAAASPSRPNSKDRTSSSEWANKWGVRSISVSADDSFPGSAVK
ncbi:MAG: hypothetical protein Q9201_004708 [Fulgogasparrea decipioides]